MITLNTHIKVILMWLFLAIGICIHSVMEMGELAYVAQGEAKPKPESIPTMFHIIWISALILPYIFSFVTLFMQSRVFKVICLVYAGLLCLLNLSHVAEPFSASHLHISQILLLTSVAIINVFLFISIFKWIKE